MRNTFLSGKDTVDGDEHSSELEGERAEKIVGATTDGDANQSPIIEGFQTNLPITLFFVLEKMTGNAPSR